MDIAQGTDLPLTSQVVALSTTYVGVNSADFKINKIDGQPYIHEILTWEYNTDPPDAPIISFTYDATRSLTNNLIISDSRSSNVSEIWLAGDLSTEGKTDLEDEGFWTAATDDIVSIPITLLSGDGDKTINAKFRNVFGLESEDAIPAEIILKQTSPTDCTANALSTTISNNKLSLKLTGTDSYPLTYSVLGDVKVVVDQKTFTSGDVVFVYVEPTPGSKNITVQIQDIAGNSCLEKKLDILLDTNFESEGIFVQDYNHWTDTANITIDVYFEHFEDQEPLEYKITGDVIGTGALKWLDDNEGLSVTLTGGSPGLKQILAQYRDVNSDESYLISKKIYLNPSMTLEDAGGGVYNVLIPNMTKIDSITITGCTETYAAVDYASSYSCTPSASTVVATYLFKDEATLELSADP